jgi:putative transcriptional regulator
MIHHHPSDSWLLDYACGNGLSLFQEVLKAHVGVCSTCRRTVLEAEELGGELLGLAGPSDDDMQSSFAENVGEIADLEQFVSTFLDKGLNALPWKTLGEGLKLCRLEKNGDTQMWMLRGQPGLVLPAHSHRGGELTLVLKGSYFCGSQIFSAGDIEEADEHLEHQPVVTKQGECICLVVTEGRLKFKQVVPRILQKFIGI